LLIAACGGAGSVPAESDSTATQTTGTEALTAAAPDTPHHMQSSFWTAVEARDLLVAGDFEGARRAAATLSKEDFSSLPDSWKTWVGEMQRVADEIAIAPDVRAAAVGIGRLGVTCGNCHWAQKTGPDQPRPEPVPWEEPPDDLLERMDRHEAGADQLWLGLIAPSEDAWRAGTVSLTRAPLAPPQESGEAVDDALAKKVAQVRQLAVDAREARTHDERARVYGDFLATCASCHAALGGGR
jgi:cytochrome c553